MSTRLSGVGIGTRTVVGPVLRMIDDDVLDSRVRETTDAEIARARAALARVHDDLVALAGDATGPSGDILQAQAMMAADPAILDDVTARIGAGALAEQAVTDAFGAFREVLAQIGGHLGERAADLDDIARRARLACRPELPAADALPAGGAPHVLVARDLSPADTVGLDLSQVLALVTEEGGPTSHTAIVARSRGIPAVVACSGADRLANGDVLVVDARSGTVTVDPTAAAHDVAPPPDPATAPPTGPAITSDGKEVTLLANVGSVADAARAMAAGAQGIGLFRTEFLFLDRPDAPSVEEQQDVYRRVFELVGPGRVVVRVLDAGADKPLPFLNPAAEPNPALGVRGLRALRAAPHVLDDQLAAVAAASADCAADVWVMAPMVADAADAAWFVAQCRRHGLSTVGVMIEIPSAALTARRLLEHVDFVSVGTNDLAQYALAADRMVGSLGTLLDPWHPAVLELVRLVAVAGRSAGVPVGVCGEAAADPVLACALVGTGVTSLSMAPAALAEVRAEIGSRTHDECRSLAQRLLGCGTAADARAAADV
jgi:phosphotransferase system enzyme I (PtsI)